MKMIKHLLFVFAAFFLFLSCQKEYSIEGANSGILAKGTLKDSIGNCQGVTVAGTYVIDTALKASNYVLVTVNITSPGTYKIASDSANGIYFRDSGYVGTTGVQTIKLKGYGTPILPLPTIFGVSFDSTNCLFSVNITGAGGTNGTPAKYNLTQSSGTCGTPTIQGTYKKGTALNSSNTVLLNVIVDTVGYWLVNTTTVNGMKFVGGGNFTTTGAKTIMLTGSGTPAAAGFTSIPVTAGTSTCNFSITVDTASTTGGGTGTTTGDSAWSFNQGTKFSHGKFELTNDTSYLGFRVISLFGTTSTGIDSALSIVLPSTNPGTYSTSSATSITAFSYDDQTGAVVYSADPTTPTAVLTVIVTSYTAATKMLIGTFSGNVKNAAGAVVPITNGKFKVQLQ